ncbi:hypothetical protein N7492_007062 [Penicillium capsulatum]|uniref:Uncharacterized protein n=1 Tax=Penicillium capsulatum TaxID=69766 RepID=A0A9W9I2Y3_9EURO|nr:hypothetical protein N7492_007062 [Penicillium capsulatum]KAJ6116896.1 hypothetical protein N7512_006621 [Penicillium capsulatum]
MVKVSTWLLLVWLVVHPTLSQPIRPPQWVKTRELEDTQSRGVWKVFEKEDNIAQPGASQTPSRTQPNHDNATINHKPPSRHYRRESVPNKSIVSVLVPVAAAPPAIESIHPEHSHAHDEQYTTYGESRHIVAVNMDHASQQAYHDLASSGLKPQAASKSPTSATSSHSISFFSYRISFPFLKFVPAPFPQLPLPGIFTTVMVLLALVWIAIVTIGLVELGNYVWQRRTTARVAAETDQGMQENAPVGAGLLVKFPLDGMCTEMSGSRGATCSDVEWMLSSGSDSDSEPDVDDYRFL